MKLQHYLKNIFERMFVATKCDEDTLKAGLRCFTTWHDWEPITPEEFEELQKLLEEFCNLKCQCEKRNLHLQDSCSIVSSYDDDDE